MGGRAKATAALAAVAAASGAAGCGGSDDAAVKATVTAYLQSLANYDGAAACAKLSKAARAPFDRFGHGQTCATLMTAEARREISAAGQQSLEEMKVVKVSVSGSAANATVTVPGRRTTISLVREGGAWKVDRALGQ